MGSTLKCAKLQEEANAVKVIIEKLPPCPSHDNNDKWIPRCKRGDLFLRAEKLKEYYGKVDEMKQVSMNSKNGLMLILILCAYDIK